MPPQKERPQKWAAESRSERAGASALTRASAPASRGWPPSPAEKARSAVAQVSKAWKLMALYGKRWTTEVPLPFQKASMPSFPITFRSPEIIPSAYCGAWGFVVTIECTWNKIVSLPGRHHTPAQAKKSAHEEQDQSSTRVGSPPMLAQAVTM